MSEINGVIITPIKKICDDRGRIMHMMRGDDPLFKQFGEVYFSTAYPGIVKGWHLHTKMTLNYVVVKGMIKLVMFDDRDSESSKSEIQEICIGDHNYCRVTIPPGVWNGWMALGTEEAIVCNLTDIPHDPNEIRRIKPNNSQIGNIPYNWEVQWR